MKIYIMKNKFIWGIILSFLLFSTLTHASDATDWSLRDHGVNEAKWIKFEYYNNYNVPLYSFTAKYNEKRQLVRGTRAPIGKGAVGTATINRLAGGANSKKDLIRTGYDTYDYDSNGKLKSVTSFKSKNKKTRRIQHTYDQSGKLVKSESFKAKGKKKEKLEVYSEYSHDDNGLLVREDVYKAKGKRKAYFLVEYDVQDRPVRDTIYANKVKGVVIHYEYNKDGTLANSKAIYPGTKIVNRSYKYIYE